MSSNVVAKRAAGPRLPDVAIKNRRAFKARNKYSEPLRDHSFRSQSLAGYCRILVVWLLVICCDMIIGFRLELFYPFWLVVRAAYESMHRSSVHVTTLANTQHMKISVLFICLTATADLMCFLFIPLKLLVFMASTYVWLSFLWQHNGGFIRTLTSVWDGSQTWPVLIVWTLIVSAEFLFRVRCVHLMLSDASSITNFFLSSHACPQVQGTSPALPRTFNSAFGAHCLGYPLVLALYCLRYYYREWRIGRGVSEVVRCNESYLKLLTEALPAVYDGPRDYSQQSCIDDADTESVNGGTATEYSGSMLVTSTTSSQQMDGTGSTRHPQNGNGVSASTKRTKSQQAASYGGGNGVRQRGARGKTTSGVQQTRKNDKPRHEEDGDSDGGDSVCWRGRVERRSGGVSIVRLIWEAMLWLSSWLWPSSDRDRDDTDDEDNDSVQSTDKNARNGSISVKSRGTSVTNGSPGGSAQQVRKISRAARDVAKRLPDRERRTESSNGSLQTNGKTCVESGAGGRDARELFRERTQETREPIREHSPAATRSNDVDYNEQSFMYGTVELERLRGEMTSLRAAETDAKLQMSMSRNAEQLAKQENRQLKGQIERLEARYQSVEKLRDAEKSTVAQLEKKYAELVNRKNDIERELMAERKARKEDGGKKTDSLDQCRERERRLEQEVDRLRLEASQWEERRTELQTELVELRDYREKRDFQVMEMENAAMKEKLKYLEESLVAENKLKQDLFRALGDLRSTNAILQRQVDQNGALSVNVSSSVGVIPEKCSPSSMSGAMPGSTPVAPPPPYNMAVQQPSKQTMPTANYLFTALQQHHSSPTGEHLLFEQRPQVASPPPLSNMLERDLIASRMGKFGAPANPQRSN